ncbi:MAG: hypothetical protein ACREMD_06150 [Gemmatimonadota bacterium]
MPATPIRSPYRVLAIIYGPALLFLALTAWISQSAGVPLSFFSRDPAITWGGHPLTGMQSNLGVLVWSGAAIVCFFSHSVSKRRHDDGDLAKFFLWSGVITLWLALDDFFLFHDELAYRYLGLRDKPIYLGYGLVCLWYVVKFRAVILRSEYALLFLASVFFGSSILVDAFHTLWESPWRIFFEDGFKILGIVTWSGYLIRTCFHAIAASPGFPGRSDETAPSSKPRLHPPGAGRS